MESQWVFFTTRPQEMADEPPGLENFSLQGLIWIRPAKFSARKVMEMGA
jgi:hypothetical protein